MLGAPSPYGSSSNWWAVPLLPQPHRRHRPVRRGQQGRRPFPVYPSWGEVLVCCKAATVPGMDRELGTIFLFVQQVGAGSDCRTSLDMGAPGKQAEFEKLLRIPHTMEVSRQSEDTISEALWGPPSRSRWLFSYSKMLKTRVRTRKVISRKGSTQFCCLRVLECLVWDPRQTDAKPTVGKLLPRS